jgi:lipopolysaccharide/colanic/teichoic acid biosynthesis glycosyltransferase
MQTSIIRALDILISIFAILLGTPLILAIFVIGYLDNRSPLFFQQRVGKSMEAFTLIKFRTMSASTQSVGTHLVDSASITKLGHFLRKTKLDELPQLVNVIRGDMSLVGPRPCLLNQLELIEERDKRGVYTVRPGITGLAQINHVDMSTPRKLAIYDGLMIRNFTLRNYLCLILATSIGRGKGDRVKPPLKD